MSDQAGATGKGFWEGGEGERALQQCQTLVGTVSDGIYQLDADGRFIALDDGLIEMVGYTREDLLGEDVSLLLDESDVDRIEDLIRGRLETDAGDSTYEIAIETADGDRIPCELHIGRLMDGEEFEGTIGVVHDITEQKKREQKLERFEVLFTESRDVNVILNPDGTYRYVTPSIENVFGHDPEELVGENAIDYIHPDDRERVFEEFTALVENPEREPTVEYRFQRADGSWAVIEGRGRNLLDEPSVEGIVVCSRDITERRERERQLSRLMDNVPGMVYCCRNERGWPMEFVSDACKELTGYDPEALESDEVQWGEEVIVEEDCEEVWETVQQDTEAEGTFSVTYRIETADGEQRWVRDYGRGVFEDGDLVEIEGIISDITDRKRLEDELEESEQRYRTLVENFPNGTVSLFDEDLCYTVVGGQLLDDFGIDPEDRIGHRIPELYPDDIVEEVKPYFQAALESEENTFEIGFRGRHLQAHTLPVGNADDEVDAGMLMVRDITERKERERELERYETIIETAEDGIYATDSESQYTLVNDALASILGYPREELLGKPIAEVVTEEQQARIEELREELIASDQDVAVYEGDQPTADGDIVPIETRFTLLPAPEDEFRGTTGIVRDITERKERERELYEKSNILDQLFEQVPVHIYVKDEKGRHLSLSEYYSDTPEDAVGKTSRELFPEGGQEAYEDDMRVIETGEPILEKEEYLPSIPAWNLTSKVPWHDQSGEIQGVLGVSINITERKEYERKLEESNERLEQFASAASHDLQEPLRMVSSYLQLIEDRYADDLDEEGLEFLEFAVDGAERMRDMIEGLLQYSRVDTQGDPFEVVDLEAVLADVHRDLQMKIEETKAEITTEELPQVYGDSGQLNQVFQNLLDNAIEYSGDEPPQIHVATERDKDEWVISVSDEGIGIDPDHEGRIFEVFESHPADEHSGTGIGLALCERIIERHGGDIWVDSAPGEGAIFSFTLPAATGESDD